MKKQHGAAILLLTVMLMVMALLTLVFMSQYSIMQTKTSSNQYSSAQAFEAGEGGLEYGLAYLNTNSATIIASATSGFINYSLPSTTLANNAKYQVVYTNPTANNYKLLTIKSTGTSADGTSTRVIQQQVYSTSSLNYAITTQSTFTASGTGSITGSNAVDAGGAITTSGWTVTGTETPNDSSLTSQTSAQLFTQILGVSEATQKTNSTVYSSSSVPWGLLSGNVWINGSPVLAGNYTMGSAASPVLLVINGNFITSGTSTIYGIVYVLGSVTTSGTFNVNGAIVASGAITMSGALTFNSTIVNKLAGAGTYAKLPGSWRDF